MIGYLRANNLSLRQQLADAQAQMWTYKEVADKALCGACRKLAVECTCEGDGFDFSSCFWPMTHPYLVSRDTLSHRAAWIAGCMRRLWQRLRG